jgi:hypothetical protein
MHPCPSNFAQGLLGVNMKVISTQNHNGLKSEVVQLAPNQFVVKFKNQQFNFDNSYNANLKAKELVGKDLCGYKYK